MDFDGKFFLVNPDFVFREEESGALLFNPKTNALHCVNPVGAFICRLCDGERSIDEIVSKLFEEFDIGENRDGVIKDIKDFVNKMINLNLLLARG